METSTPYAAFGPGSGARWAADLSVGRGGMLVARLASTPTVRQRDTVAPQLLDDECPDITLAVICLVRRRAEQMTDLQM